MQYYPFDSRNKIYRKNIGAVAEGQSLGLRLLLHRDACVHEAFLRIREDSEEGFRELALTPAEWLCDYRFYDCELTLSEGLYWYSFRYTSDYGEFFVTKTDGSLGTVCDSGDWWQQTVYQKDFDTPHWLDGGIIYQIFPDRFYGSGEDKKNVPQDRFLCDNWAKQPAFRQTQEICRLGNDYYGGDLKGITEKLDYLKNLGVSCIYLNPIFEAHSNHRYNTADYMKIDPLLGDENDLRELCKRAKQRGIAVILDGVFSHTGDDSIYFNRKGRYDEVGAYNSTSSPYFSWYNFKDHPDEYAAWWDVPSLPETKETDEGFLEFITGENGVLRHWLRYGISGWRLDVADELPDLFLDRLRKAVKDEKRDAYILGEVWEDASNKISYGTRRRFLRGAQLDSVMNYPFANAIVDFVGGADSRRLINTVLDICENYPPCTVRLLMNHIGTHDTMRILTRLGKGSNSGDREWQSQQSLTDEEYARAKTLLRLAATIQFTLPGVPSVFYGDEAGVQGYGDPFCRGAYPWGREDTEILEFYKTLGAARRGCDAFKDGAFIPTYNTESLLIYERQGESSSALIAVNRGETEVYYTLPDKFNSASAPLGAMPENGVLRLAPLDCAILVI